MREGLIVATGIGGAPSPTLMTPTNPYSFAEDDDRFRTPPVGPAATDGDGTTAAGADGAFAVTWALAITLVPAE